jgi:hexosaminidase
MPSTLLVRSAALAFALLLCACGTSQPTAVAARDCNGALTGPLSASRPVTIPALREWREASGAFALRDSSRIVIADDALRGAAEVFAEDLQALTGRALPVTSGGTAAPGDVLLILGECDLRIGAEGYRLNVGDSVVVSARAAAGAFYATRTLLQWLHQGPTLAGGEALDWPRYAERGLMVDVGRKSFTFGWLQQHLKELAYLKLNQFHLHFSENIGFRIESDTHPEIVAAEHLSKAQVRTLVALAARYFIRVTPEIGMPGHMGAALASHPELQLVDVLGRASPNQLDVTNPAAVQFAHELIDEYLPLFPGAYWHTGGDEYMAFYDYARFPQLQAYASAHYGASANGKDAVHGFMNDVDDFVRARGKTLRVWADDLDGGSAVVVHPDIVAEWWTNFSPLGDLVLVPGPQALLDRGHVVLNAGWFPTYYVVGSAPPLPPGLPPRVDIAKAYESWSADQFAGPLYSPPVAGETLMVPPEVIAASEPRNLGAELHVWCDGPDAETEGEVATNIFPRLRVIAQKTWESPPPAPDYAGFAAQMQAIGHAPGYDP